MSAERSCIACDRDSQNCDTCGKRADLHEHVYDEWYCQLCWDAFCEPAQSQDAVCFALIERTSGG